MRCYSSDSIPDIRATRDLSIDEIYAPTLFLSIDRGETTFSQLTHRAQNAKDAIDGQNAKKTIDGKEQKEAIDRKHGKQCIDRKEGPGTIETFRRLVIPHPHAVKQHKPAVLAVFARGGGSFSRGFFAGHVVSLLLMIV